MSELNIKISTDRQPSNMYMKNLKSELDDPVPFLFTIELFILFI